MAIAPFITPPQSDSFWLVNARLPLALLDDTVSYRNVIGQLAAPSFSEALVAADVEIRAGKIAAIAPLDSAPPEAVSLDITKSLVFPCFVDLHTHLDKGQSWNRAPNPDGTFDGALKTVMADANNWSAEDLYQRMEFGLRCSYAHGTKAIRTHFDAFGDMAQTALSVIQQLRQEWRDRLALQAVCLVSLDYFLTLEGETLADLVAENGAILGGVAYPNPDLEAQIDHVFTLAAERELALDFHVDESLDPASMCLRHVAKAKLRHGFAAPVLCGHCCSLSVQSPEAVAATLQWVKEAEIGIVSLPMCNLYLQDRHAGQMPRYRGVTLLHELKRQSIPIAVASDNCRDPFYAYGDHDGLEVLTQAVRIGHLDRPIADWCRTVTWTPADLMALPDAGRIGIDQPADLVLFKARSFNELLSRPQSDRVVLRKGRAIDTTLPDYAELDELMSIN
ncbi:MAG: cytosine deaminase [Cyanobacteria bacterium J06559_3]